MRPPDRDLKQEQRSETVTVKVGAFRGTTVTLTYAIEATLLSGAQGGGGGFISARPTQVGLRDQNGERIEYLDTPQAPGSGRETRGPQTPGSGR